MMAPKATGLMLEYARVSTDGQSLDAQQADLRCAGCTRIFVAPFQVRSATVQHRRHGGANGRGKGQGQGL